MLTTFCNPGRHRDAALAAPLERRLMYPQRLNDLEILLVVVLKKERTSGTQYVPDGGRFSSSSISARVGKVMLSISPSFHQPPS